MKAWWSDSEPLLGKASPASIGLRAVSHCGDVSKALDLVVAVPVRDEGERIVACIDALSAALAPRPGAGVVLMVNNSTDASARKAALALSERGMTGLVVETELPSNMSSAGWARRLALDVAANWAAPGAVLMTTDADGRVAPDWAEANLKLLRQGAHLVCGRFEPDAAEEALLPVAIAPSAALESAYSALSVELDARLDPRPHDPWPHHGLASGASLAIRVCDYRAVGRMPPLPCSEDRAFAALVERCDLHVRHSDKPLVTVSCRIQGRAKGGMADALAARIADPDTHVDQRLLPAEVTARRALLRGALREAWREGQSLQRIITRLRIPMAHLARARSARSFGAFWAAVEAGSPGLAADRMRPSDLSRELPELHRLVACARLGR